MDEKIVLSHQYYCMHLVSEIAVVGVGGLTLLPCRVVHHPLDLVRGHWADADVRVSEVGAQL